MADNWNRSLDFFVVFGDQSLSFEVIAILNYEKKIERHDAKLQREKKETVHDT